MAGPKDGEGERARDAGTVAPEIRAEWADIAASVARANLAYHQADAPEISDADYDALKRRLLALEAAWPAPVSYTHLTLPTN